MWTRKQLKEKGKFAFQKNFWKTILVSLIMTILVGGTIGGSGIRGIFNFGGGNGGETMIEETIGEDEIGNEIREQISGIPPAAFMAAGLIIGSVALVAAVIAIAVDIFLINPIEIGGSRFFLQNLNRNAEVKELGYAFDHEYRNLIKVMLFRDLYLVLWSLLLIVPGIVKSYEYRMIPYILAENPYLTKEEAFARSRALMNGQKWNAFVLDLSFIGWELLSMLTMGILSIFYVNPYRNMTNAALYEELAYRSNTYGGGTWTES